MLGLDVQLNIISYAVVSAKYEDNKNLTSSFMPLVEHLLLSFHNDYVAEASIIDSYKEMYGYPIHAAILDDLLKSFVKQGKVERLKGENIQINKEKLESYGKSEEYEASLRALVGDFDLFLKKKSVNINRGDIAKHILKFIRRNALEFNSFLQYESSFENISDTDEVTPLLVDFFLEERRNDTRNYKFICSIYCGIVLSTIMIAGEDPSKVVCEEFSIENVLLDSNYIFRLLDLQTTLEHQAAIDTFNALKDMGCVCWVCKETIKQIADTLHNIIEQYSESASAVLRIYGDERFTGLASACIRRDLTPVKLEEIVSKLEKTLENKFGVKFIDPEEFNSDCIKKTDEDFISLAKVKRDASDFGIIHDLFIINVVRSKRDKAIYKPDQAKWWVLTDDNKLTRWRMQNLSSSKVNECLTESQLATIIWVCNPKSVSLDGFFNAVIALRNQRLVGNRDYQRIAQSIDRQKEKYAQDPDSLEKLSLVFSQKMLRLDDLISDDEDAVDSLFETKMRDAAERLRKKDIEVEQKESALHEERKENKRLTDEIQATKALLSAETEALITTWKNIRNDKYSEADREKEKAKVADAKFDMQVRSCRTVLSFFIAALVLSCLPLVDQTVGEFYNKHQLVCNLGWTAFALLCFFVFDIDKLKIGNFLSKLSCWIIRKLAATKIVRNYEQEALEYRETKNKLMKDALAIQDSIDQKLSIKK